MYNLLRIGIQGTEWFRACSCLGRLKRILAKIMPALLTGVAINLFVVTLSLEQPCASAEAFWCFVWFCTLFPFFFQPITLNRSSFRDVLSETELDIMLGGGDIFSTKLAV